MNVYELFETAVDSRYNLVEGTDTSMDQAVRDILPFVKQHTGLKSPPRITLTPSIDSGDQPTFGMYNQDNNRLVVATQGRHIIDVLRTLAHELVHHSQREQNRIKPGDGETGSDIENEANAIAGVIMREFGKAHPTYFNSDALDEEMTRRGFLGAMGGAALAATGVDAQAKAKAAPAPAASNKFGNPQAPIPATGINLLSNNTQAETILHRTALSAGIKGTELAQFLAQCSHESGGFKSLKERFNGDPKAYFTRKYDPKYAPTTAKIIGNTKPGDGVRYFGRGFIQLTGRSNYEQASRALGIDLVNHPEQAANPAIAAKTAVWYWQTRVKPEVRNFADTRAVTYYINSALRGLDDRHTNFLGYKRIL